MLKWNCVFIHDSQRCMNKCLVESRENILRQFSPSASLSFHIHWPPINSIRPPSMIDLSMIMDRPCLPTLQSEDPLWPSWQADISSRLIFLDNDTIVYVKNLKFYNNCSIDFCCINFFVEQTLYFSVDSSYHTYHEHGTTWYFCIVLLQNMICS